MQISVTARRTALVAAPILLVAGFWIAGGDRSAAGAALGAVMVVLFFAGGRAPMFLANSTPAGQLFLLVALGYLLRVVVLLAVLVNVGDASWLDRKAVAVAVVSGALLWTGSLVHAHLTSRRPTLEPSPAGLPAEVGALR
jgi:ATP synthase protein I